MTPLAEMGYTKASEMAFEAIPGLILQLVHLMKATPEERMTSAFVSVLISTGSTAMIATSLCYDMETECVPLTHKTSTTSDR
jgi:hypothetical protein